MDAESRARAVVDRLKEFHVVADICFPKWTGSRDFAIKAYVEAGYSITRRVNDELVTYVAEQLPANSPFSNPIQVSLKKNFKITRSIRNILDMLACR